MTSKIGLSTVAYTKFVVENSMLEHDLKRHMEDANVKSVRIMETPIGFYILIRLWKPEKKEFFLCSRRNLEAPKLFTDLNRLNNYIKENALTPHFVVIRGQPSPPKTKPKESSLVGIPAERRAQTKAKAKAKAKPKAKAKKTASAGK